MKTVKDYGAKANGVVNDTKAIQKADEGGRAVFPAGTYLVGNLVLKNPPVFQGFVRFRPFIKFRPVYSSDFVIKFSTDSQRSHEPVQGSFHVDLHSEKIKYNNKITAVIIEGGGWYFPKITINGNKQTDELLSTYKTGLQITDQGDEHNPATHNHIGYLGIIGCNTNVLFDVDKSSYAKNNLILHAYLKSNTKVSLGDTGIKYLFHGGLNYTSNKFNQAYIEKFDRGISFDFTGTSNTQETGISGDFFDVHFDDVTKEIFINNLAPKVFIFDRNTNSTRFHISTVHGGMANGVKLLHACAFGKQVYVDGIPIN